VNAVARAACLNGSRELNLAGSRIDDAKIDRHIRVVLFSAEREAFEAQASAAAGRILRKRGDCAHHEILRAGQFSDFRGS